MSLTITQATLTRFASKCCDPTDLPAALEHACAAHEITTARRLTHFLGHLYVESGGLSRMIEGLDYSPKRLMQVWPNRFPTIESTAAYAHNPTALANYVYGGRFGNTEPGDGWKYRGRGLVQLTFKDNYHAASAWSGLDLVNHPEQASEPIGAATIAAAFWKHHGCNQLADGANETAAVHAETQAINGGQTGYSDREAAIAHAKLIWT